ncbi:hypothetical protein QYS49_13450 [Marivirga salinae]|uniref:Uncharacterized protein n=1 Tax=Marivirga salinarum TaxID=3059078 RepID=A0AA49J9R9_9BACT|nr:hypothetical protein [Marivirga sp. BDSF4-3]WKK77972.1 hypothetical protein QYS49_13450 [Marivirga sp. BDSF4-3]
MEKLPMIDDPRFSDENRPSSTIWDQMKVAHSYTSRAPYPSKDELDELYGRKPNSGKYELKRASNPHLSLGGRR